MDDDRAILDVLKIILEEKGFKVTVLAESRRIFDAIAFEMPDLILLDIWMSGPDGLEIMRELKTREKTRQIPVLMISANNDGEKISRDSGANGFIAKPFEMDELVNIVGKNIH